MKVAKIKMSILKDSNLFKDTVWHTATETQEKKAYQELKQIKLLRKQSVQYGMTREEIQEMTFFSHFKIHRKLNVVFEQLQPGEYLAFVFWEDLRHINNPEDTQFQKALNTILFQFDNGKEFDYDFMVF